MGNNRCVVVVYFAWVTVLTFTIHHQRNVRPPQTQKLMRQDGSFSPCVQTKRVCLNQRDEMLEGTERDGQTGFV